MEHGAWCMKHGDPIIPIPIAIGTIGRDSCLLAGYRIMRSQKQPKQYETR
jgi:hypothetical protein